MVQESQESHFAWCINVQLLNSSRADEASLVLLQLSSSGLSKTTMGMQSKQRIGSVWGFCKEFEDRLDFKCNLREVIQYVSRNLQFCFMKVFTHLLSLRRNKLNIACSFRHNSPSSNNMNFVLKDWLVWRFYHLSGILRLSERDK